MNQKEEIKDEKKRINDALKESFSTYDGIISEISLEDVAVPKSRLINDRMVKDIFNEKKEKFYNKEFSKLCTELKNCALKIGRNPFEYQYEFLLKNDTLPRNKHFTKEQTLSAYKSVLEELYTEVKAA